MDSPVFFVLFAWDMFCSLTRPDSRSSSSRKSSFEYIDMALPGKDALVSRRFLAGKERLLCRAKGCQLMLGICTKVCFADIPPASRIMPPVAPAGSGANRHAQTMPQCGPAPAQAAD